MRPKEDIKLKKLIDSEIIKLVQEKRDELCAQAIKAIDKIQKENCHTYNQKRKKIDYL